MSALATLDFDDGFSGGGFDEFGGDGDFVFSDGFDTVDPSGGDLGTLPDPNTTIGSGADWVFSDPEAFGNAGDFGSFLPADSEPTVPRDFPPYDGMIGGDGFDVPDVLAGTPADVPGGVIGVGTSPDASGNGDSVVDQIFDVTGGLFGGIINGVLGTISGGGSNGGVGGSGAPKTSPSPGGPSAPVNAKAQPAWFDLNSTDTVGLYLVAGVLLFVLWKK